MSFSNPREAKGRKNLIDALKDALRRHQRECCLILKYIRLWRFLLTLAFSAFQLYVKKVVKIDFSNNQIVEIKKIMPIQVIFMHK